VLPKEYRSASSCARPEKSETPDERRFAMSGITGEEGFSQAILDALDANIAVIDAEGSIVHTNASWRRFAAENGAGEAEACQGNYLDVCDRATGLWSEEARHIAHAIREIIAGRSESFVIEYPCHSPDKRRWFIARVTRLPGGGSLHLVVSHQDITQRRLAEEALRESEERYRILFNSGNDAIFVHGIEADGRPGRFIQVNDVACQRLGYTRDELLALSPLQIDEPARSAESPGITQRLLSHPFALFETEHVASDGRSIPVEISARMVKLNGQPVVISIARDLTERKRIEADRLIVDKLESTGRLAGGIAHDFNNLLGIILGNIELARMPALPGEEMARCLAAMRKAVLRAQGLTQRLITFSRGGEPVKEPVSLADVIEKSLRTFPGDSRAACNIAVPRDLWIVMADEGQISQVIQSMLFNAQEAMTPGGAFSLRASNEVLEPQNRFVLPAGKYVCLEIADQGTGIAEEILPKIFDPYFSTKQKRNERGLGLGLAICRSIIQKHGGAICVASRVGAGTTFQVYLPATGSEAAGKPPLTEAMALRPAKILVMDDEEMVRTFVHAALTRAGCAVEMAEDGGKAIAIYREAKKQNAPFAAVILDLTVPGGMGGLSTLRRLQEIDPAVKAIASSGATDDMIINDFKELGFAEKLIKPYSMAILRETLSRVIGG
jgi:PAS domain S-box-containing protein